MNEEKKNHIPGIYNYCDRWCDRCDFTSRCLLFSNESKIATFEILNDRLPEADEIMDELFVTDDDNENDFEINEDDFDEKDFSDEDDDSINSQSDYEDDDDDEEDIDFDDEKEPPLLVEELAKQYFDIVHEFINTIDKKFNFSATPAESISLPQIKKIYNNFEIVSWYHSLIFIKTKRASQGKKEFLRFKDKDSKEFSKYDSDGTAKVAALSVENSLKALSHLQECLPDYGTEIIKLSSLLQRIFKEIEREFPDYSKFKRPGLDD